MATDQRSGPGTLSRFLRNSPGRFELLQALMILAREKPDVPSLGCSTDPQDEVVRLRGPLLPAFSASQISSLRPGPDTWRPMPVSVHKARFWKPAKPVSTRLTLHTPVFGLGGPDGPLPYAYQEWLQQRARDKNHGPADFLDMFQHRLLSLLYQVQRKYRIALPYRGPTESPVYQQLLALCGLQSQPASVPAQLPEKALIARAGLLANRRRSLAGFQNVLVHYFKVRVRLYGYKGGWRTISARNQTCLGREGRNLLLGRTALAGTRVWDEHLGIVIGIGPLADSDIQQFLPGQLAHQTLAALVNFYFGVELECTLTLHFEEARALGLRLTQQSTLGRDSWLSRNRTVGGHSVDVRLSLTGDA